MLARLHGVKGLICIWLLGCSWACGGSAPSQQQEQQVVQLGEADTALVQEHELRSGTSIAGTLQPQQQATVAAQLGGTVRDVRVEIADHVEPGELLARLEVGGLRDAARSAHSAVDAAQRALALAKRDAERSRKLVGEGALAQQKLDVANNQVSAAASQLQQARARVASAEQTLSEATIRAPIGGVISQRSVSDGDVVSPGKPLFTIIDPSSLRLSASVPAIVLGQLSVGTPAEFRVYGQSGKLDGEVTRIAPAADATTGQISILVSIPNTRDRVLAGLFAQGWVYTERVRALAVPLSAVDFTQEVPRVTVLRGGHAAHVAVRFGVTDQARDLIQVLSGVKAGERVVLGPERSIPEGTLVQLKAAPATHPSADAGPQAPRRRADAAAAGAGKPVDAAVQAYVPPHQAER